MLRKRSENHNENHTESGPLVTSVRWALSSLSLSMLMPSLDTSIANAALPALASSLGASFQEVQWVVLAYLLAITTLLVSVGRVGDLVGRKRLLLFGISLFTVASLLCAAAPTFGLLIAARAAQGLGAAVMMSLTVAFVAETVPKGKTGSAMGLLGTMSAVGTTLGPSIGGILAAGLGWRMIFFINVPVGILNFFLAYRHLPVDRPAAGKRPSFDVAGTALLAFSLAGYALSMTLGGGFGGLNTALLAGAALGFGLFIFVQTRAAEPLIRLAMFRDPVLSSGLAISALVSTVMMATLVVGPFYLSKGLGLGAASAGLALSAGPLVATLMGVPAGFVVDRFGSRRLIQVALSGIAAGTAMLSVLPPSFGVFGYIVPIIAVTGNYALFQAANNTAMMTELLPEQRGVVSGMLGLSRNLGLITGASVMGAVFAAVSTAADIAAATSESVSRGTRGTFAVATSLIVLALVFAIRARVLSTKEHSYRIVPA